MFRAIAVAAAYAVFMPSAPHPLIGTWKVTYPWHIEVVNGVVTPTMEIGKLTVEARGDSLVATLITDASPQFARRRLLHFAALAGSNASTTFVMRDLVTMNMGGAEQQATAVSTWILSPAGDQLTGSLERRLEGVNMRAYGPQRLTGSRVRP
jgi:hypothetical protein